MQLYDPPLLQLLSFLTRKQAWLLPRDIARGFRLEGEAITPRTVQRWFAFLRAHGGFVYYPYPKANVLGLQDVLVRVHGVRNPTVFGVLPYAASFNVDVGMGDGRQFVSQSYWVPGPALRAFEEYWEAARDLGLLERVEILRSKNSHTIYSPFHQTITADGRAEIRGPVDNSYFAALLRRNLKDRFEVRLHEKIAASPLVIPIVVEHIWRHYSSQHVWKAIQESGEDHIRKYGSKVLRAAAEHPGSALRMIQEQWNALLEDFDEVFLQPRVFFDWPRLRDAAFLSFFIRTESDAMIEAAVQASQRSIVTALNPGLGPEGWCHVRCFLPSGQILPVLRIVQEFHRGAEAPVTALQDREATLALFQPTYCQVDWRLFDPESLSWRFDGDRYVEVLKRVKVS